ncbi:MAG: peptide transporter ATP-binding protein [Clostridia bacterium]|jgi:oligopeptide transport system ATP-binding protein|uniref:ABC transporter ATP-binding protein n=1 Tax=Petroclostridium xylanilyticum TaxID=1792311 RepID=UPI000B980641|nr:ABC transporter ATP-binding protein [Petroclostridium xylanilyticum]MBZ4645456.1 peptide transporter ATP-binding protein [Clostridia bacterium]
MNKILEVRDLHVSFHTYAGEVKAVRGVNFEVYKGEALAIVGESGCGKSVTAQSIMQLLPMPPAKYKQGSILFEGQDLLKKSEKQMQHIRGNEIGMIFQDPMTSLNPTIKIGRQIAESLMKHKKLSRHEAYNRAIKMLEMVAVAQPDKRVNQYPHEFSGGMRQRAMIALALACEPKLLIADEPTTALDVTIQAQILELLKDLQKRTGTSIILITHDLGVVAEMCDRVIVMYAGKVVETGTIDDIFYSPQHPYTKGLLKSVPRMDMNRNEALHPIVGTPPDLFNPPAGCPFFARCQNAMKICENYDPDLENIKESHYAACWLQHSMAQVAAAQW